MTRHCILLNIFTPMVELCRELIVCVFIRKFSTGILLQYLEYFEKEKDHLGVRLIDHTDIFKNIQYLVQAALFIPA